MRDKHAKKRFISAATVLLLALSLIGVPQLSDEDKAAYGAETKYFVNDHSGSLGWSFTPSGMGYYHEEGNLSDDGVAYCLDQQKTGPDGVGYTKGAAPDQVLSYILKYGYPATTTIQGKSLSKGEARAVTQIAIWFHREGSSMDGYNADTEPFNIARSLYRAAVNYKGEPFTYGSVWNPTNSSRQHVLLAAVPTGYLTLTKTGSHEELTAGNSVYTLAGAVYGVYKTQGEAAAATAATPGNVLGRLVTLPTGKTNTLTLEEGTYYVKELTAPKGYAVNDEVMSVTVTADKTASVSATDQPQYNLVSLMLQKVDAQTDRAKAQGAATLGGATYRFAFYGGLHDTVEQAEASQNLLAGWVYQTDDEGKIDITSDASFVSGDDRFLVDGQVVLPMGTLVIKEETPSKGYKLDTKAYLIKLAPKDQSKDAALTFEAEPVVSREEVIRGDMAGIKIFDTTNKRGAHIPFLVTSKTTGERHVIFTDDNGQFGTATSWNKHSNNTNGNDGLLSSDSANTHEGDADAGVWFGGYGEEPGAAVEDEKGALPYDTYVLEELPCDANTGYELLKDIEIVIKKESIIMLGTLTNDLGEVPSIGTTAHDKNTGTNQGDASKQDVTIIDEVHYQGLRPGSYVMEATLMDVNAKEPIINNEGQVVTSTQSFTTEGEGTLEMNLSTQGDVVKGKKTVVFERVYLDDGATLVAEHADYQATSQTVDFQTPVTPKPKSNPKTADQTYVTFAALAALLAVMTGILARVCMKETGDDN